VFEMAPGHNLQMYKCPGKHFQLIALFKSKARAYPREPPFRFSTLG